ncbi:MAG: hypothetical protein KAY32_01390 [Candidatus Eisenbacteria sp.]|nr:hypothetical protein [Candidatus Eisenbacteria bacterium]
MHRVLMGFAGLCAILIVSVGGCGQPRNCLVIPAQIELVQERRDALLTELEATAQRVDRRLAALQSTKTRFEGLQAEKALLDSLTTTEGD